ncbi:hypothetical protein A0H76_222 [Hepatospora eriocheir]|nr:hypothetical protein A0H76_222 [Hepatospora eriocheir]
MEQKGYVDDLERKGHTNIDALKIVTLRIRNYLLQKEGKLPPKTKPRQEKTETVSSNSIYSNLFK